MPCMDRHMLRRLAENRRRRLMDTDRPVFALTSDEVRRSTATAMRLAKARCQTSNTPLDPEPQVP